MARVQDYQSTRAVAKGWRRGYILFEHFEALVKYKDCGEGVEEKKTFLNILKHWKLPARAIEQTTEMCTHDN